MRHSAEPSNKQCHIYSPLTSRIHCVIQAVSSHMCIIPKRDILTVQLKASFVLEIKKNNLLQNLWNKSFRSCLESSFWDDLYAMGQPVDTGEQLFIAMWSCDPLPPFSVRNINSVVT